MGSGGAPAVTQFLVLDSQWSCGAADESQCDQVVHICHKLIFASTPVVSVNESIVSSLEALMTRAPAGSLYAPL